MRRWSITALIGVGLSCAGASADGPADERLVVDRVLWPVFVEPAGCTPDLEAIRVTENGAPVEVTSFDRSPRPTLHTLLIDTSASMAEDGRLEQAKDAARRYVGRLRPGERVMLLSFDESLVMRAPPRSLATPGSREAIEAAIDGLDTGTLTLLRDALEQLILHVEAFPERQVIVVLTDGADVFSRADPLETVRSSPARNLTIFTVGIAGGERRFLGRQIERELSRSAAFLAEIAQATGGAYHPISTGAEIGAAFDAIRDRLDSEAWLGWTARPLGASSGDTRRFEISLRRVRIRSKDGACTLINPRRRRVVTRDDERGPHWPREDDGERPLVLPLPMPPLRPSHEGSDWHLTVEEAAIRGRVGEVANEGGLLYQPGDVGAKLSEPAYQIVDRDFRVTVPPLASVGQAPEDVLLHWLAQGRGATVGRWNGSRVYLDTLAGQTFLQLAEFLADALYRYFDDYREWVRGPLRRSIESELRDTLPGIDDDDLATLVAARLGAPTRAEVGQYLAAWLGDVTARELTDRLQRRVLLDLCRADPSARPATRQRLDDVRERWDDVRGWLGPPDRVRVVTPLLLLREGDRAGFYRIVLPRPSLDGPPQDMVATVPQILVAAAPLLACASGLDRVIDVGVGGNDVRLELTPHEPGGEARFAIVRIVGDAPAGSRPPDCIERWSGDGGIDACFRAAELEGCDASALGSANRYLSEVPASGLR